ncbi:MAG: hypothetical protein ACL93V_12780 [Candidatus Electrothrix sp. YB6]
MELVPKIIFKSWSPRDFDATEPLPKFSDLTELPISRIAVGLHQTTFFKTLKKYDRFLPFFLLNVPKGAAPGRVDELQAHFPLLFLNQLSSEFQTFKKPQMRSRLLFSGPSGYLKD